jgi:hypothetical protein
VAQTSHGGYRRPANPAPVSGPGSHSRRTDGKQPVMTGTGNGSYGDEQAMEQIQAGAAMGQAATPQMPSGSPQDGTGAPNPLDSIIGLGEPSQQPGTPVTDGAAAGPGAGPGALGIPDPNQADAASVAKYLPAWIQIADDPNTLPGFRAVVRHVIANQ